jgi:hypothetical protein
VSTSAKFIENIFEGVLAFAKSLVNIFKVCRLLQNLL